MRVTKNSLARASCKTGYPLQRALASIRPHRPCHCVQRDSTGSNVDLQRAPSLQASEPDVPPARSLPTSSPSLPYRALAVLSGLGTVETAYLTLVKLAGDTPYCPVSGCDSVLTSSYSELYGVPLSALGCLTYGTVCVAASLAAVRRQAGQPTHLPDWVLTAGCTALATTSSALLYILATQFPGQSCAWCYASVGLSYALAASLLRSLPGRALGQVALPGLGALAGVAVLLAVGFGPLASSTAGEDFQLPYQAPEVLTASSPQAVSLARRLRDAGARMYGAFWCSHCFDQKQAFGSAAMADFPYVECYPEGWQRGAQVAPACEAAGVRAFPTWVINGRLLEGELTLDSLEQELGNLDSTAPPKLLPESPFKEQ